MVRHRVVLSTVGSLGDLHPFIALALRLKRRNVTPVIASFAEYQDKVESEGLEFRAIEPAFATVFRDLGMDQAEVVRRVISSELFLFRDVLFPYLRTAYESALTAQKGADLVLSSSIAFGARLAAERARIPCIAVVLQPMMFMSAYDPPTIPHPIWLGPVLRRLGPTVARVAFNLGKHTLLRSLTRPVRAFRAEMGLPDGSSDSVFDGQFTEAGAIGLYSPLLGPSQPDYPSPSEVVGFAYYDSESGGQSGLDPELQRFIANGTAPIVFTLGSTVVNYAGAEGFYRDSLAAARKLGRRAILLMGERIDPRVQEDRGEDFLACRYVPHSQLFPHAAAIVHQGGVGTLAQALRVGRPELIVPFYADQFDNADRAVRLCVGRSIHYRQYRTATAAQALSELLRDPTYEVRAQEVAAQVIAQEGAERAAELVCRFLESGSIS
jgi:UDP:flavonoid glycosyltransferase YjiC (YdhE family)